MMSKQTAVLARVAFVIALSVASASAMAAGATKGASAKIIIGGGANASGYTWGKGASGYTWGKGASGYTWGKGAS